MRVIENNCCRFEEAYVVFVDNVSLWWLRFLKKGFRHCYVVLKLNRGTHWIELNPYSNQLILKEFYISEKSDELFILNEDKNIKICKVKIENAPLKCAPLGFFTCVEFIKRIIGIHNVMIITPYQLYKKLKVVGKKS